MEEQNFRRPSFESTLVSDQRSKRVWNRTNGASISPWENNVVHRNAVKLLL